jgi:hypothetical protein
MDSPSGYMENPSLDQIDRMSFEDLQHLDQAQRQKSINSALLVYCSLQSLLEIKLQLNPVEKGA